MELAKRRVALVTGSSRGLGRAIARRLARDGLAVAVNGIDEDETLRVAAAWGRQQFAQPLPVIDALIAATAQVHGMTVVTRNVKDFELAGVQVLNPFTDR